MDAPQRPFAPLCADQRPLILFRVESLRNFTFNDNGDMVSRAPHGARTAAAFDNCLSWRPKGTPFIPLTSNWAKAMWRVRRLIREGVRPSEIKIIAVWSKDLPGIYHAYDIAASLGYNNHDEDPRRQLRHHQHEFLVSPGIWADDYRVLAIFNASSTEQAVDLHIPGFHSSTMMQCSFARSVSTVGNAPAHLSHASYELQKEMYSLTGVHDDTKLYALVLAICGTSYQ